MRSIGSFLPCGGRTGRGGNLVMLQVNQINFERNENSLFAAVSFTLQPGQILQIIGENGAGKTTLLRILAGLLPPTSGEICWQGQAITDNPADYRAALQYLGHQLGAKAGLTVQENLQFAMALAANQSTCSIPQALQKVNLSNYENKQTGSLSAGQLRRMLFAKLLLCQSRLWLLDEPFAALDQQGIKLVESLLMSHLQTGGMVVLTSHQPFNVMGNAQQQVVLTGTN